MLELNEQNAVEILHAHGHLPTRQGVTVRELSGGVSNAVFLIEHGDERFVVKQARGKLRVAADWQCSVERIWREVEVLAAYAALLDGSALKFGQIPALLWKNNELYAYAMTAAPPEAETWKQRLLAGKIDFALAEAAGSMLGYLHGRSWNRADLADQFQDRTYFAQLRLEPYYLAAAQAFPRLSNPLSDLVDQTWRERHALVHGDFSPKNLLVTEQSLLLIDFEVGHFGDPAFDLGFFLTHLYLKAIHLPANRDRILLLIDQFAHDYSARISSFISSDDRQLLWRRTRQHLAGCLVARVHGKSPVDYLAADEQARAVGLAEKLFAIDETVSWEETTQLLRNELNS
ncbi:phosphotransferase family protein [Anatilimnocola floriformis]|uniref:phosphotransferase family protein n=1 Tax=Anatilimnocola floriformis TaxID=2948575 RepID=UPI0020C37798|nr:aminoglycoside phosphotransferase family protein [Anatilimnocola floriformis]